MAEQRSGTLTKAIAAVLRAERSRRRLTQKQLADAARVDQSHISQVLQGKASLRLPQLSAICALMGIRMSDVIRMAEDSLSPTSTEDPTQDALLNEITANQNGRAE